MTDKAFYIGLAGYGVVGSGLCSLLQDNADMILRRTGKEIIVKKILVRDAAKIRDVAPPPGAEIISSQEEFLNTPGLDAVVELIGGLADAKKIIVEALQKGLHVVTANKALLAEEGIELLSLAAAQKKTLRYEASVAGAIPIISTLKESLSGNRISSLTGILNGTSNYILSSMTTDNLSFSRALSRAQELGYAEADPSLDIDGIDAAHKLVILIRLAFGVDYPLSELSVEGIRSLSSMDIRLTREFGYRIKLIGQVRDVSDNEKRPRLAAGVFPALAHHTLLMARTGGAYNAIHLNANASGPLFFHGRGAGSLPTAGAVLADLIAVARNENPNNSGFADASFPAAEIVPADEWPSCYYLRAMVEDTPGVLRDISGCLAAERISVAQMIQKAEAAGGSVPLIFMTHETCGRAMKNALASARAKGLLKEDPVFFRVLEKETGNMARY